MKNIVITEHLSLNAMQTLKLQKNFEVLPTEFVAKANALLIRSKTRVDSSFLEKIPGLELIVTATSGFDHIDLSAIEKTSVKVMHTPDANAVSASELTWALVLACSRKLLGASRSVKSGDWKTESLTGWELSGKTYGIVGLGRIGSRVSRIARAFGMEVCAFDPYKADEYFVSLGVRRLAYDELLMEADILSFHVPKTRETFHMLSASHMEYINPDMIVINTSRGSVFAESDICKALEQKKFRSLGLDVFETEPLSRSSNLLKLDSVVLSPHVGAATHESYERASLQAVDKVIEFFKSGKLSDSLPPQENWAQRSTQHQPWD